MERLPLTLKAFAKTTRLVGETRMDRNLTVHGTLRKTVVASLAIERTFAIKGKLPMRLVVNAVVVCLHARHAKFVHRAPLLLARLVMAPPLEISLIVKIVLPVVLMAITSTIQSLVMEEATVIEAARKDLPSHVLQGSTSSSRRLSVIQVQRPPI